MEAHPSFVAAPAQSVEGHRDGEFAEAQREANGDRRGARSTVVGQAGRAGVRTLGRRLDTSWAQRRPDRIRYRPPSKEAAAGSAAPAARRHSVAARGGFAGANVVDLCLTGGCNRRTGRYAALLA